jgi:hypothetical protein
MKTVISLTTIPSRLNSKYELDIEYCIQSLLKQSYTGDYEIHLNIPHFFKLTNEKYVIPEKISNLCSSKFKIFRTEDYGSITKLTPTIQRLSDPQDTIIVVDDDIIYHEDLISEHLKNQKKWPEYVIGYDGMRSRNLDGTFSNFFGDHRDYSYSGTKKNSLVDVLQHYKSVSYKLHFFESDFDSFVKTYGIWDDDRTISAYFATKKRGRIVSYYEKDPEFPDYDDWLQNVGSTFPVIKHTQHDTKEGCNLHRSSQDKMKSDKGTQLWHMIDKCYSSKTWTI